MKKKRKKKKENKVEVKQTVKKIQNEIKPKILLVEDNEMNRKIVITMLRSHNMTCDVAINGAEAVKAVSEKEYDIVFMDCQMPVMDGYESTREIRRLEGDKKHTTIVAMTANAMQGDSENCIEAGMDEYISKPINFDTMFKMIEINTKEIEAEVNYTSIIDNYLDNFTKISGLDKEDAEEIFQEYIKCLPDLLSGINNAIEKSDFEKIARLTHELKGSSGTLRITSIHELAIKLEEVAKKQEIDKCVSFFIQIKDLFK